MTNRYDWFPRRCPSIVAVLVILIATISGFPSQSYAASPEQRCTALGANCTCSEPLQMTALNPVVNSWWDPNDSTVKQCNGEGLGIGNGTGVITRNSADLLVGSDPSVLA